MYYFTILIIILSFLMGSLEIAIGFPPSYSGLLIDLLVLILFLRSIFNLRNYHFPLIIYLLIFIILSLISKLLNGSSYSELLIGLKRYIIPPLFIYVIANSNFTDKQFRFCFKLILFLFLIQIPLAFVKLSLYGFGVESYFIGTIANSGGSISTVLPMLGSCLFFILYLYHRKNIYLLFILGMFFFGIVGGKRAVVLLVPISLYATYLLYNLYYKRKRINIARNPIVTLVWIIISTSLIYIGIRLSPTLNPDNQIGGRFDINYAIDYFVSYEDRNDYDSNQKYQLEGSGRLNAFPATTKYLYLKKSISGLLFGIGPGVIERSLINPKDDSTFENLGLGYGVSIVGLPRTILQYGIITTVILIFFYWKIINKYIIPSLLTKSGYHKYLLLVLAWTFVFFIDFFFYSQSIISTRPFYFSYYLIIGYSIKVYYRNNNKLEEINSL